MADNLDLARQRRPHPSNAAAIAEQWRELHGAKASPTRTVMVDGFRRQVWCNGEGREVIESNSIAGMGHGTPLNTEGPDRYGASGPFMIDVGISSTFHIAAFWELASSRMPHAENSDEPLDGEILPPAAEVRPKRAASEDRPLPKAGTPAGVGAVIEKAVRAAGLMK